MQVTAVIGMNYGDEGKGHITNWLCDSDTLNVRFNGGSQAAHAVFMNDGRSHIFHHVGSGSMNGARTLLANKFIVNPLVYAAEIYELSKKTLLREIFIDPRCRVTTPWDMAINAFNSKYHGRHDTCGLGINETIERSQWDKLCISMRDMECLSDNKIISILKTINSEWVPHRLKILNLPEDKFLKYFNSEFAGKDPVKIFCELRKWMFEKMTVVHPDDDLIRRFIKKDQSKRKLVFEGAQGMLLDQNKTEFMPYLTRSNTGLKNILDILKTSKNIELNIYLVTRSYLTRHGDGPVMNESKLPYQNIDEPTNPFNNNQGGMRYGYLDNQWYTKSIKEVEEQIKLNWHNIESNSIDIAMTCIDHIDLNGFKVFDNGSNLKIEYMDMDNLKIISDGNMESNIKYAK